MRFFTTLFCCLCIVGTLAAQTELEGITRTLNDYIEGTANGEVARLQDAFHEDFNLYFVKNDSLQVWNGADYVAGARKSNRIGRIISIDYEGDAASAKIEVDIPRLKRVYTDYLLLLKFEGRWKIVHKSFTFRPYPE